MISESRSKSDRSSTSIKKTTSESVTQIGIKRKNSNDELENQLSAQKKAAIQPSSTLKNKQSSPSTKSEETIFQKVKTLFRRTTVPSRLVGRTNERQILVDFWEKHVLSNLPGCLYISGMPGTGKTALLTEVMRTMEEEVKRQSHQVHRVVINCMSMKEPKQIYHALVDALPTSHNKETSSDIVKRAEEIMLNSKRNALNVVILDEIDSLITRDQDVLYKLFEWASIPTSRLVLIGIANALDLTDRILPRLRAKNCEPDLLNFNPYRVDEITEIIQGRLEEEPERLIQPTAIELCARKVAASMGDLRTALDVCRQATELAELEYKRRQTLKDAQQMPLPKVTVAHVMKVLNGVFGTSTQQKLKQLNLQQKVVLGALLVLQRRQSGKALTLGQFRDQYSGMLTGTSMTAVSRTELNDLVTLLETLSIISLGKHREERMRKIQLNVQENEITEMIHSVPILKEWMEEVVI
ncbi:P-loop containing nucleoside triphosphate hydrolase protein [Cokeromyces recurvatus]|uniref:P-loop containing nucleoside triphosphate hydrolase protein n=1 Tax=Cokeromyces recurvatus TaxID=90255 RepID=UPI00221E838A|nr:P-loop containing nucleoside triphosphate hydrolase protein [Cokeromyces recurvatus]KAI7900928.1 P-loop containing nucleoside triphosphate hydrolase protein [Cokeromyces recurvatus]